MKTREKIISAILAFVMCFSCMSSLIAFAATDVSEEVQRAVATENEWDALKERLETYEAVWDDGNLSGAVSNMMVKTALMGNGDLGVNSDGTHSEKTYLISKQDFWDYERVNRLSVGGLTIQSSKTAPPEITVSGCGGLSDYPLDNIVDGNTEDYGSGWACSTNHGTAGEHWFIVDLAESYSIKKIVVCHQGTVGAAKYNTADFTVSVSADGVEYETVKTVTGNTANETEITLSSVETIRFVKVEITEPTTNNGDVGRMGELRFFDENGKAIQLEPFTEKLSIVDGTLSTDLVLDEVPVNFYNWVSATENVMITEITSTGDEAVELSGKLFVQTDYADKYPLDAGINSDGSVWVSKTSSNPKENEDKISWKSKVVVMSKMLGAESTAVKGDDGSSAELKFTIPAGKTVYIVTVIGGGGQNYDWQGKLQGAESSAEAEALLATVNNSNDIDELKSDNDDWWKEYWLKSYIDIGDEQIHRYYYGSLYYMACTAREDTLPSGLYGIWATTDYGRWNSDYHLNYNMIAPFYGLYSSNRAEFAKSVKDPLLDYMENGKERAKNDLTKTNGVRQLWANYINGGALPEITVSGIKVNYETTEFKGREDLKNGIDDAVLYPVGIGPWGSTTDDQYWMQVFNSVFSATALTAYYNYTKDADYFKEVYPFLLANANFYEKWCEKEVFEDGTYRYNIWSGAHEGTFDFNANDTIGPVKNLLECLIDGVEDGVIKIGTDVTQEKYNTWVDMYENLADYATSDGYNDQGISYSKKIFLLTEDGIELLKGSANVDLEFVVPAHQLAFDSDPELMQIARNSIEFKELANSNIWNQKNNTPKLFTMAIRAGYSADYVLNKFKALLNKSMLENYTIDDNTHGIEKAGAIEFINAMMLQSDNGIIKVFPNWTGNDASFTRLRERGAFIVSSSMRNGRVRDIEVTSEVGGTATFVNPWNNIQILDSDGNAVSFTTGMTKNSGEKTVSFETVAGESYTLCEIEEENVLKGKTVSILGDSISSFEGWSNNANHNSTIGNNQVFYNGSRAGVTSVNEVYWKQLINKYDMELCVNNSSSGSRVVGIGNVSKDTSDQGYENRPYNLHRNVGERVDPDVIIVYMGLNDLMNSNDRSYPAGTYDAINWNALIKAEGDAYVYSTPTTVAEAYAIMIHKISVSYPDAEILIMNLPESTATTANDAMIANLQIYNSFISSIANRFDATLIDLYGSAMSGKNTYSTYASDAVHPQPYGHDLMTMLLEEALFNIYGKEKNYISSMEQSVTTSSSLDLSEIGDADWIQLGSVSSESESGTADGVRKNVSENLISAVNLVKVENHPDSRFAEGITEYWFTTSWNDGNGESNTGEDVLSSVLFRGVGSYAQFSVPAKSFDRTLTLSLGVNRAYAELEVWFESNPNEIYSIATIDNQSDKVEGYASTYYTYRGGEIVTINFSSTVPGDKLIVRYKITGYDSVNLTESKAWQCQALINAVALTGVDPCANGHTEVLDAAYAPTCTENGATEGTHCSVCNEIIVKPIVLPARGHSEAVAEKAVAPTCTEGGRTESKYCTVCNEMLVEAEDIPATGHDFADATTEAPKTCKTCGATEGEKLPVDSPNEPVQDHSECESNWFAELWNAIINFFRKLFGKPEKCVCGEEI